MTLKYTWRSFQPRLSFPRPLQQSLACFRVARSPSNSWASCSVSVNKCSLAYLMSRIIAVTNSNEIKYVKWPTLILHSTFPVSVSRCIEYRYTWDVIWLYRYRHLNFSCRPTLLSVWLLARTLLNIFCTVCCVSSHSWLKYGSQNFRRLGRFRVSSELLFTGSPVE